MEIQILTSRFFRLLGLIVVATLVAFATFQADVAHASVEGDRIFVGTRRWATIEAFEPITAARGSSLALPETLSSN